MKLRLTVVYEYDTGADDTETLATYGTTDPEECARLDMSAIGVMGDVSNWLFLTDVPDPVSYRIEPVQDG